MTLFFQGWMWGFTLCGAITGMMVAIDRDEPPFTSIIGGAVSCCIIGLLLFLLGAGLHTMVTR